MKLIKNPYFTKATAWFCDFKPQDDMAVRLNHKIISYAEYQAIKNEICRETTYKEFREIKKKYKNNPYRGAFGGKGT